jgi:hypothetical protein
VIEPLDLIADLNDKRFDLNLDIQNHYDYRAEQYPDDEVIQSDLSDACNELNTLDHQIWLLHWVTGTL